MSRLRCQRTVRQTTAVEGFGYYSGRDIRVEFRPAEVNSGVTFVRSDLGIDGRAELSPRAPREGRYALELAAKPMSPGDAPQIVARPLVWITSPPVRATADQLLEISGWVRVPEPIVGSIDGVQIVDSLGGPELALRLKASPEWQPFRLVRGVSETSDVAVTFVLAGLGSASIDDVAIPVLGQPSANRFPPVATVPPYASPELAPVQGPLFLAPGPR